MKKNLILLLFNTFFTLINQIIYHYEPASDSLLYIRLAKQFSNLNFFDPATNYCGHSFFALFLAIIGLISYNHYIVGLLQTFIFSLSVIFLIEELQIYLNKKLFGLLLFVFIIPEFHLFNGYMLTESLGYSLIILIFGIALRIINNGINAYNMLFLSFLMGCAILNRMELIIYLIPIAYLIFPQIKNRFIYYSSVLLICPVCFLIINGFKNYKTYNNFKLTTYHGGETIFGGNNENLDGSHHNFSEHRKIFIPQNKIARFNEIMSLDPRTRLPTLDSFYIRLATNAWKKDYIAQLKVIPHKFAKNWFLPGNFDIYTSDTTKTQGLQLSKLLSKKYFNNNPLAPVKHGVYMIIHFIILIIIGIGIWNIQIKNRLQLAVLLLLLLNILLTIPFCGLPRWHVTIFPVLIIAFTPQIVINKMDFIFDSLRNKSKWFFKK